MINKKIVVTVLLTGLVSLWGAAGVTGSPHDLSATTWAGTATEDNGELCVYCHTPHAANTSFTGAPIWNKDSAITVANDAFTTYGTTVGQTTASTTVNPPSMACLSCHDGVSAVNSVVNAPSSGAAAGGDELIGSTATIITAVAALDGGTANALANIGSDLSNDHPVSITYDATKAGLKDTGTTLTGWTGATDIASILRDTGGTDYVECGSCHDPHNGADTGSASSVYFLRVNNDGSALCLGCHDK